jgi:UrcA family protein
MTMTSLKRSALAAGAFGALLMAAPAYAQDDTYQGPPESVEVIAPPYHLDHNQFGTPLEKQTLSIAVRYDDLDLSTRGGAHELRARIRDAASSVCEQLAAQIPIKAYDAPDCFKEATSAAFRRADTAIGEARGAYGTSYEY